MDVNDHPISLPSELEREIFEIAYYDAPRNAVSLMLIARRAHIWIEPFLYRILRISNCKITPPLYTENKDGGQKALDIPRLQRFAPYIRHVLMQNRSVAEVAEVLKYCTQVENLALWAIHGVGILLIPLLEVLPLKRLSFDPSCFFSSYEDMVPIPFNHRIFRHITQLEIINMTLTWAKWQELARIPNLRQLALAGSVSEEVTDVILEECSSLEALVVYHFKWMCDLGDDGPSLSKDKRVMMRVYGNDLAECWERRIRESWPGAL